MSMYMSFHGLAEVKATVWLCSDGDWMGRIVIGNDPKAAAAEEITISTDSYKTREDVMEALFAMVQKFSDSVLRVQMEESIKDKV